MIDFNSLPLEDEFAELFHQGAAASVAWEQAT
jgi:hypothetical protein